MIRLRYLNLLFCLVLSIQSGMNLIIVTDCNAGHDCCFPEDQVICCPNKNKIPSAPIENCRCSSHGSQPTSIVSTVSRNSRLTKKSTDLQVASLIPIPKIHLVSISVPTGTVMQPNVSSVSIFRLTHRWRC